MTIASRFLERAMKLQPAPNRAVQVERDLRIPMTDGVELLADWYHPDGPLSISDVADTYCRLALRMACLPGPPNPG